MKIHIALAIGLIAHSANAQSQDTEKTKLCMKDSTSVLLLTVSDIVSQATGVKSPLTGGSLTALSATLGVSTMIMTFQISMRHEKDALRKEKIGALILKLKGELEQISCFADKDREVYNQFLVVTKLPSGPERKKRYDDALKNATIQPIEAAKHINAVLEVTSTSVDLCSSKVFADLSAAMLVLSSAEEGMLGFAKYNIIEMEESEAKTFLLQCEELDRKRLALISEIGKRISK